MTIAPGESSDPRRPDGADPAADSTVRTTHAVDFRQTGRLARVSLAILRKCGIDRAIAYTLVGRGWGVVATPISWLLISRYLLPAEQGFYYTFGSVIALNVLLELGLAFVLVQFASHEKAHLEWNESGTLSGSEVSLGRLAAVWRTSLKWYGVAAVLIIVLVMPAGMLFFSRNAATTPIAWRGPWVFLAIASAGNLLTLPFLAVVEGCGRVSHIASLRLGQSVLANAGLWITLRFHGALYASPVFQTVNVACAVAWLISQYGRFFRTLLQSDIRRISFSWSSEVWPFQWRIALSWLGGYLFSQIFNPVLFATHGPVVAGQMGMSLSVCNALVTVSFAWVSTKASPFGVLVARRRWKELDDVFFRTFRQSLSVLVASGLVVFAGALMLPRVAMPLSTRILAPLPFGLLLISCLLNHVTYSEAMYLRAHKAEPFLVVSVVSGVLTAIATLLLARPFGATGVCLGNFACTLVTVALGTWIFFNKRSEWHA